MRLCPGEPHLDYSDTLLTIAELGIALAGFSSDPNLWRVGSGL